MHHLDPVGRLTPGSLDVSRAAARRHAQLAALENVHGPSEPVLPRRQHWARWARLVRSRTRAVGRVNMASRVTEVQ